MTAPRVSIITAVYNHEQYLPRAIESVLAQTYPNWELLLWDDGSQDGSLAVARGYAAKHPGKIRVFTHQDGNRGQEATRNAAIAVAEGELLCLLDSDDWYHERKLERLVPLLEDPEVGFAYGDFRIALEPSGKLVAPLIGKSPSGWVLNALIAENFIGAAACLFRRSCLSDGLRFDSRYKTCGEYPLWLAIALRWKFAHCPEVAAYWRSHGKNTGKALSFTAKHELARLFEDLLADSRYTGHRPALLRAVAQKHYDLANEYFLGLDLGRLREESRRVLRMPEAPAPLRLKAGVFYGLSFWNRASLRVLSGLKKGFWKLRHPAG